MTITPTAPLLLYDLPVIMVTVNATSIYSLLPLYSSFNSNIVKFIVDLGTASSFSSYKDYVFKFNPSNNKQAGTYNIKITLQDASYPDL